MAMPRHALADDLACGDVERCEQGRRSVPFGVVRHRAGAAFLQRQSRLRAIERLDLAFFVDRQHQLSCPRFLWTAICQRGDRGDEGHETRN